VQFPHAEIDSRQKKFLLAGEVAIQGSLAHLELVDEKLGIGVRIAVRSEEKHSLFQDFFLAAAIGRLLRGSP
jgi:hypothetical protein